MTFDFATLITNRTQSDVARLKALAAKGWAGMTEDERGEWRTALRGAYNAEDLNRVGAAMRCLKDLLDGYGYAADIAPRDDWAEMDSPTEEEWEAYRRDVATLRGVLELPAATPPVPATMRRLGVSGANDIEQILFDLSLTIERVVRGFTRCGAFTAIAGGEILPCADNDRGRTWAALDALETTWRNWQVADWFLLLYGNLKAEGEVT